MWTKNAILGNLDVELTYQIVDNQLEISYKATTRDLLFPHGMAMLQVSINPLLRNIGGEKEFAFNSVLGQLFFGLASFIMG